MSDRVRLNFYLNINTHQSLVEIAARDDRSISDLIREACRQYIVRDKRKGMGKFFKGVDVNGTRQYDGDDGEGNADS